MTFGADDVISLLVAAGFERLAKPLVVAGAPFEFDAAVRGTGVSNDLIAVAREVDASRRLVGLCSGLTRVLDSSGSRRPVSLILLGDPSAHLIEELERYVRVLVVPSDAADLAEVRRAVSVLLPLELPTPSALNSDPLAQVSTLLGSMPSPEQEAFLDAATEGADAVRSVLHDFVEEPFAGTRNGDG